MLYDVIIVGAGPVGCRTAELVSKKGYKVLVIEEHKSVGKPVHCSGLISWRLKELLPDLPKNIIINTVTRAKFSSSSASFELESRKPVYVVNRARLDKYLYRRAKDAKVKIMLGTRFLGFVRTEDAVKVRTTKGTFTTKILVGADGPNSTVAKIAGLVQPDNRLVGIQTMMNGNFEKDCAELWFDRGLSPEFFAWVIPLSKRKARLGLATKTNAKQRFDKFLKMRIGKTKRPDVAGTINFGLMDATAAERIMLVGDAACQVKPFSGGGVIYSLISAGLCANACVKALRENMFGTAFLQQEYDKKWKSMLQKPIERGILYSNMLHGSEFRLKLLMSAGKRMKFILQNWDVDLL